MAEVLVVVAKYDMYCVAFGRGTKLFLPTLAASVLSCGIGLILMIILQGRKTGEEVCSMKLLHRFKREQQKNDDMNSIPKNDKTICVTIAPKALRLFFQSGQSFNSDGLAVHFGIEGFFHKADRTVYIEEWGAKGTTVEKIRIPEDVVESKEAILRYLRDNASQYNIFFR